MAEHDRAAREQLQLGALLAQTQQAMRLRGAAAILAVAATYRQKPLSAHAVTAAESQAGSRPTRRRPCLRGSRVAVQPTPSAQPIHVGQHPTLAAHRLK
jgi:hypothetical protein